MSAEARRPRSPREAFSRRRSRVAVASVVVALTVAGLGLLLASPGDLGTLRWAGVGVAWWGTTGALAAQALVLLIGGDPDRSSEDR